MKILFAIKNMNSAKGGAERVLSQVASGLDERAHDVCVLTTDQRGGESYYPLSAAVKRVSLAIGDAGREARFFETLGRIRAMRAVIKTRKPDVIIAFMHSMFIPMSLAAIGTGVPVIASEHIVPAHYRARPFSFLAFIVCSFFVSRITVLSEAVRLEYPWVIRRKMVVVSNPVEAAKDYDEDVIAAERNGRKVILNVGRLCAQKDQAVLIQAFARLAGEYPEWDVKIFGEGELRDELAVLIDELGMDGRVVLAGTTREIGLQYVAADIFALPSVYESFGLATAEAMSYGVPAVGFADCAGTNEVITNGVDGVLVNGAGGLKGDRVGAFADALEALMQDADLRAQYGAAGRDSVVVYGIDGVVQCWDDLITL